MKFSKKILAAVLCAALLCVPALAAGSGGADDTDTPSADPQYTMTWGTVTRQNDGSLLVQKPGEDKPTDGIVLRTENAVILDAVSGESVGAGAIQNGSTVYAWIGARSPMTMSLPPQTTPELLLVNVPADYAVPQYDVVIRQDFDRPLPTKLYDGEWLTLSSGAEIPVFSFAEVKPYLTRNRILWSDLVPGTRVLVWTDTSGQASRILVFPYQYAGYLTLDSTGDLHISGTEVLPASTLRKPYGDERLYVPIRAVAEAAGYSVFWDPRAGVVVKNGSETLFSILPDSADVQGSAVPEGDGFHLSGPCLIAGGTTYLELHDLAALLNLFCGG